jgi:hypothetical protein
LKRVLFPSFNPQKTILPESKFEQDLKRSLNQFSIVMVLMRVPWFIRRFRVIGDAKPVRDASGYKGHVWGKIDLICLGLVRRSLVLWKPSGFYLFRKRDQFVRN